MGQGVKRTQRDYSLTFKLALVEQIEKGELTYKQAQVRYGIQGRSTVLVWLRKHGRQDWSQGASVRAGRSITMPDPDNQRTAHQGTRATAGANESEGPVL